MIYCPLTRRGNKESMSELSIQRTGHYHPWSPETRIFPHWVKTFIRREKIRSGEERTDMIDELPQEWEFRLIRSTGFVLSVNALGEISIWMFLEIVNYLYLHYAFGRQRQCIQAMHLILLYLYSLNKKSINNPDTLSYYRNWALWERGAKSVGVERDTLNQHFSIKDGLQAGPIPWSLGHSGPTRWEVCGGLTPRNKPLQLRNWYRQNSTWMCDSWPLLQLGSSKQFSVVVILYHTGCKHNYDIKFHFLYLYIMSAFEHIDGFIRCVWIEVNFRSVCWPVCLVAYDKTTYYFYFIYPCWKILHMLAR